MHLYHPETFTFLWELYNLLSVNDEAVRRQLQSDFVDTMKDYIEFHVLQRDDWESVDELTDEIWAAIRVLEIDDISFFDPAMRHLNSLNPDAAQEDETVDAEDIEQFTDEDADFLFSGLLSPEDG